MKRLKSYRALVAISMMLIIVFNASSYSFVSGGIYYNVTKSTYPYEVEVTNNYDSYHFTDWYSGSAIIPSTVYNNGKTYTVTKIGDEAFSYCYNLTGITLPNTIKSIGESAFDGCSKLKSIQIPNSVSSIEDFAFSCTALTSIQIPNSVSSIGWGVFAYCENLINVDLPNSINYIKGKTFFYCSSLTNIEIPESVTSMDDYNIFEGCSNLTSITWNAKKCNGIKEYGIFYAVRENITSFILGNEVEHIPAYLCKGMSKLTSIEIPNSVTSIGDDAFSWCTSLTSIEIPNSVTSIGERAFKSCTSLTSIEIPNSVTSIGKYAFTSCFGLTSIEIPNSVISIGDYAFHICSDLINLKIGNSVSSIGKYAFSECDNLENVTLGNSIKSIGGGAFLGCTNLKNIYISDLSSLCNIEFSNYESNPLYYAHNLYLNDNIIEHLIIPDGIIKISERLFYNLDCLKSVTISNSVTQIESYAFSNCKNLTSVTLGNSVISINTWAFSGTGLTSLEIPKSVEYISSSALSDCSNLNSIFVKDENLIYDSRENCNAIIETASNTLIAGCKNTIIPNSITSIGDYAFNHCDSLTCIEIPNSVTSIGNHAFEYCSSLASIEIPNSVTSIDYEAFYGCKSLTSIEIPNSLISLGYSVFLYSGLTNVIWNAVNCNDINDLSTSIYKYPFEYCDITCFTFGENVEHIPANLCRNINEIQNIKIPNSVKTIGAKAFYSIEKLSIISLGKSLKSIGKDAFKNSNNIRKIECYGNNAPVIYNDDQFSEDIYQNADLYVPIGFEDNYKYAYAWSKFTHLKSISLIATSILLDRIEICLEAAETATLTATVLPTTTSNKTVKWRSSNEGVATVDTNGVVTAISVGEATITATTVDGSNLSASCKVTVIPTLAESITLDKSEISLEATETTTLVATVLPELTTDKAVIWSSSDEGVAIVDANGVVTAISVGEAIITAMTNDGSNLSSYCKVTIVPTLAASISLNLSEYEIVEKSEFQLTATVLPELTTNKGVVWNSSDMWIASVDENGLVRAYSVGEATITATTTDGSNLSASCKVTVVSSLAQSIILDKTEVKLKATETTELVATVLPETTSNKGVEWTSSDESVAIVSKNGVVTAIAVGEATITVTTVDGSNLSASCTVTVVPTLAESIALDKTEISLEATETATLVATVLPELATDKSVKWSSSDESVATVDENGVVTAIAVGEAIITATTVDGSNFSASCKVTVVPTLAVSIELDKTEVSVEEKSDFKLTATILPEHTTNKEVAWSSSDKWVAVVDNTGLVTIYSAGEAVITATTTDGTNLSATCHINVYTGVDGVNCDDLIVLTIGDNIVVKNAQLGSTVNVYASNGALIKSVTATDGSVVVEAPIKGIYVVAIDGKSFKVMVK